MVATVFSAKHTTKIMVWFKQSYSTEKCTGRNFKDWSSIKKLKDKIKFKISSAPAPGHNAGPF